MTAYDRNDRLARILLPSYILHKRLSADDIQRCDAEELLRLKDTVLFKDFCGDGHGGVDGVGNDKDKGFGAGFGNAGDEVADYAGVDLEQVVACHAWLA